MHLTSWSSGELVDTEVLLSAFPILLTQAIPQILHRKAATSTERKTNCSVVWHKTTGTCAKLSTQEREEHIIVRTICNCMRDNFVIRSHSSDRRTYSRHNFFLKKKSIDTSTSHNLENCEAWTQTDVLTYTANTLCGQANITIHTTRTLRPQPCTLNWRNHSPSARLESTQLRAAGVTTPAATIPKIGARNSLPVE